MIRVYKGEYVAYFKMPNESIIVLAVGLDEIGAVRDALSPTERAKFATTDTFE